MPRQQADRSADQAFFVAFSHAPGIGPVRLAALMDTFGSVEQAWRASPAKLRRVLDRRSFESLIETRRSLDLTRAMGGLAEADVSVLTLDSPDYPKRLREVPRAPYVLYVQGSVDAVSKRSVAVIGTRRATEYGRMAARRIAADIGECGVAVVSGLALGIDAEAHRAAVDTVGGTIAVLGCGHDVDYPRANRSLRRQLNARGTVVSEYPLGTAPQAGHFPARNRIVSGLTQATVVVEAGVRSGALITARLALDQGRDVFAVPGSIFSDRAAGSNGLLSAGAAPALTADDVISALDLGHLLSVAPPEPEPRDDTEAAILRLLGAEPMHIDTLCREAGVAVSDAARALTMMEMKGWVHHMGSMRWMAVR